MFGKMMNNFYYGKSGKGDFKKEDLPRTRWQLFWEMLRIRLSALCRMNLMTIVVWLPTIIVIGSFITNLLSVVNVDAQYRMYLEDGTFTESFTEESLKTLTGMGVTDAESMNELNVQVVANLIMRSLLLLIPCIAITGPVTAGVSYVVRNWARDEHAFIWSDFKDAVKENWKQSLVISLITSVIPTLAYVGWEFYGQLAAKQPLMMVPQILVMMIAVIWALCVTYIYPLLVTYQLKLRDLLRNGLLLGVARLPMSVGIRLLHCVPVLIGAAISLLWNPFYGAMILFGYYFLIGFSLSRFVTASYTNAVFDRFLNPRIEGAKVNQGLRQSTDDDEDDEDPEERPDSAE